MLDLTSNQKRRFYLSQHADEFSGCVEWIGGLDKDGYGLFYANGQTYKAHRLSWALLYGDPKENHVCHLCDNPSCVNTHHLFLGTHLDNMRDRARKGRTRNNNRVGETSHLAKVSDEVVANIRQSDEKGSSLAIRYGLSQAQVSRIKHNISRKTT